MHKIIENALTWVQEKEFEFFLQNFDFWKKWLSKARDCYGRLGITPPSDGDLTRYATTIQNSSGNSSIEPKKYLEAYGEVHACHPEVENN